MKLTNEQDFQTEIVCNSMRLFETVASTCEKWNETLLTGEAPSAVDKALHLGLVVGATDIDALRSIRSKDPSIWILCPGVGAQGGEANVREQWRTLEH